MRRTLPLVFFVAMVCGIRLSSQAPGAPATGRSADFIVLNANPLENIRNAREIAAVYMRGAALVRSALVPKFTAGD